MHSTRGNARGQKRRRQIMDAARRVFERDGYLEVDVGDIVAEAGVARGSFYTYFTSKLDVWRLVSSEVAEGVYGAGMQRTESERELDPVDALCLSNRRFVEAYQQNARICALGEQLAHIDGDLFRHRVALRRKDVERIADLIRRWQRKGLADPSVDPVPTAAGMLSMISNLCYWLFVGKDDGYDLDQAVSAINDIWVRAIDLRRKPNRRWLQQTSERV